jgi:hypothetical protein
MKATVMKFKLTAGLIVYWGGLCILLLTAISVFGDNDIDTALAPPKINFDSLNNSSIDSQEPIENHYINFDSLGILFSESLPSSLWIIDDLRLFGAYEDSIVSPTTDSIFLQKYEYKIKRIAIEANEKPYSILKRFSFSELPYIKLFLLNYFTGGEWMRSKYTCALFNIYDSAIYVYGGNISDFNDVIRMYLSKIIQKRQLPDLINLYLNTFSLSDRHVIISDTNDYKGIWEREIGFKPSFLREQIRKDNLPQINREIEILKRSLCKIECSFVKGKEVNYYFVGLCAWGTRYGKLENWTFRISDSVFEVNNIEPIAIKVGPGNILH